MKFHVLKYDPVKHELCGHIDGQHARMDPYVGCAIAHDITDALVGKTIEFPGECLRSADGTYLPSDLQPFTVS